MKRNRNKSRRLYKNGILLLTAVLWVCVMLGGCTVKKSGTDENMLGADLESEPDRVVITVTTSVSLEHFAAAVEERFPDIRLVQDSYMGDFRINEHIARVSNRDWGDLVIIAAGLIPKADMSGLLMDLSTQPFPAGYNSNSLQMDHEGHIYLLPGPAALLQRRAVRFPAMDVFSLSAAGLRIFYGFAYPVCLNIRLEYGILILHFGR